MNFLKVLLVAMLVMSPIITAKAHAEESTRSVASEKSKTKKKKKGKKGAKKSAKAGAKKGKKVAKKGKGKKVAKSKSHAPDHTAAPTPAADAHDPAQNFEVSEQHKDELPVPNNGNLTE